MERAAEAVITVFDALPENKDRFDLHVRLLALAALNAGDLGFIEILADAARAAVLEFIRKPKELVQ
jgi:hypothetical protein